MFAQGCLRCTTRSEARVQRPAPSPHTAASPTSRYPRNSPIAPRAPSPYSGRYGHRHLLVPMLLFISKTTRAVIRVTPIHITVIWHVSVSFDGFDGTFASSLFQVSLMLPVRFCLISCVCVSHALFVHLPKQKVNRMFCFTWLFFYLDFISPKSANRERYFCTVAQYHQGTPSWPFL